MLWYALKCTRPGKKKKRLERNKRRVLNDEQAPTAAVRDFAAVGCVVCCEHYVDGTGRGGRGVEEPYSFFRNVVPGEIKRGRLGGGLEKEKKIRRRLCFFRLFVYLSHLISSIFPAEQTRFSQNNVHPGQGGGGGATQQRSHEYSPARARPPWVGSSEGQP